MSRLSSRHPAPRSATAHLVLIIGVAVGSVPACGVDDAVKDILPDDDEESPEVILARAIDAPKPAQSFESHKAPGVVCYDSFKTFKNKAKQAGRGAPAGHHWHHIVNQNPDNKKRFGRRLQCTDNLIVLPKKVHQGVSGHYQSKQPWTGNERVYQVINRRSWRAQYSYGLDFLRKQGVQP